MHSRLMTEFRLMNQIGSIYTHCYSPSLSFCCDIIEPSVINLSLPGNLPPPPSSSSSESSCEPELFEYREALMSIPISRIAGMRTPRSIQCFRSNMEIND